MYNVNMYIFYMYKNIKIICTMHDKKKKYYTDIHSIMVIKNHISMVDNYVLFMFGKSVPTGMTHFRERPGTSAI